MTSTCFSLQVSTYDNFFNVQLFLVSRKLINERKISSLIPHFLADIAIGLSPP